MRLRNQAGFTIYELLIAIGITAMLMVLSAGALRNYWLTQSLDGSADEIVSQMRRSQEATRSESHPIVFGLRLRNDSSEWDVVRYDPEAAAGSRCTVVESRDFSSGTFDAETIVVEASFPQTTVPAELADCRADLSVPASDQFVFFYPKGTATAGRLNLRQPALGPTKDRTVTVTPLTGRVTRT